MMDMGVPDVQKAMGLEGRVEKVEAAEELASVPDLVIDTAGRTFAALVAAENGKIVWKNDRLAVEKLEVLAKRAASAAVVFSLFCLKGRTGEDESGED